MCNICGKLLGCFCVFLGGFWVFILNWDFLVFLIFRIFCLNCDLCDLRIFMIRSWIFESWIFRLFLGNVVCFLLVFSIIIFYFLFLAKKESSKEKLRFSEMKLTSKNSQPKDTGLYLRGNFYTVQTAFQLMPAFS